MFLQSIRLNLGNQYARANQIPLQHQRSEGLQLLQQFRPGRQKSPVIPAQAEIQSGVCRMRRLLRRS
jgi:hypothetical protein